MVIIWCTCAIVGWDSYTEILLIHRNPMNSQKSYEFTEILRIHRNPKNSQKSSKFTEILRIHKQIYYYSIIYYLPTAYRYKYYLLFANRLPIPLTAVNIPESLLPLTAGPYYKNHWLLVKGKWSQQFVCQLHFLEPYEQNRAWRPETIKNLKIAELN